MNIYNTGFILEGYTTSGISHSYQQKIKVIGNHTFSEGKPVIEGKDYELKKVPCIGCEGQYSCYNWQIGDCRGSDATIVALPLTDGGGQGEKDKVEKNNVAVFCNGCGYIIYVATLERYKTTETKKNFDAYWEAGYRMGRVSNEEVRCGFGCKCNNSNLNPQ